MHPVSDDVTTNHASESGRWLKLMADIEHEPESYPTCGAGRIPFMDYDRERRISATGAFGAVSYNPPAGSLEP